MLDNHRRTRLGQAFIDAPLQTRKSRCTPDLNQPPDESLVFLFISPPLTFSYFYDIFTRKTDLFCTMKTEKKRIFRRILKTYAPFKWKLGFNVLMTFISYGFFIAIPYFIGKLTTTLASGDVESYKELLLWGGLLAFCYLTSIAFNRLVWFWEMKYLDCDLSDHIVRSSVEHMQTLSIGQHRNQHSLVTMSKLSSGENALKSFFSSLFYNVLPMIAGIILALVGMITLYPKAGLVAVGFAIVIVVHGMWLGKKFVSPIKKYHDFQHKVMGKSGKELVQNMGSLKIAGEAHRYGRRHLRHRTYRKREHQRVIGGLGTAFIPTMGLAGIGRTSVVATTAYLIYLGHYEVGALAAIIVWADQSLGTLQSVPYLFRNLSEQWVDIAQYFEIMDTQTDVPEADHPVVINQINGDIVFENVFFTYPGADEHSIHDVSLEIRAGQKVGIVGPSGAGKSTLLSLLQLAYVPGLGSVRVDGIDLGNVDHDSYRECTGFIEQTPLLLARSLKENLMFGLPEHMRKTMTEVELEEALQKVGLEDLIPRLHKGVGEIGNKLSGGQKQRVAIARMLLKSPDILIVDEATSAVDPSTEKLVHDALEKVSPGSTRIFVAHRLSTVQDSDLIVVMDQGRIVAQGKHEELLESCELYANLVKDLLLKA